MAIFALAGLLALVALVARSDASAIFDALRAMGWGLVLVVLVHLIQMTLSGFAWQALCPSTYRASGWSFVHGRWIRESVSSLLPVSQIGGDLAGVRVMTLRGVPAGTAGASIIVDLSMEAVGQIVFTLIALALFLAQGHGEDTPALSWAVPGIGVATLAVAGFVAVQRGGLFAHVERFALRYAERYPRLALHAIEGLDEGIRRLYRTPRPLAMGGGWHLLSWLLGTVEVWLILHLMGIPITIGQGLVIEGLSQAARSAAFMVPGGLGVQEGSLVVIGALYGIPSEHSLALALAKRGREILLGVPGLLAWHLAESQHARNPAPGSRGPSGTR